MQHRNEFRNQVIFLLCYLAASFILLSSVALRDDRVCVVGALVFGLMAVGYALSHIAVLYFAQGGTTRTFRRAKPEWDDSAEELSALLNALMETSALYRDEKLSLRRLAQMLGVEPRRLSYHLHARHSLTFPSYVNEWRLKAVCRDLLADPHRSILDTALENGFNSKSSFNAWFFKRYGKTPREFRKEHRDGHKHSTEIA